MGSAAAWGGIVGREPAATVESRLNRALLHLSEAAIVVVCSVLIPPVRRCVLCLPSDDRQLLWACVV